MNGNLINVGIAEIGIGGKGDILRTVLGSCVGICLYDSKNFIGGMSHIMLPTNHVKNSTPQKYADSAIPLLLEKMLSTGADEKNLTAKIFGGATMFKLPSNGLMGDIGKNNINKVKEILASMGIKIIAEDVGGDFGRTIDFIINKGSVSVRSMRNEDKIY